MRNIGINQLNCAYYFLGEHKRSDINDIIAISIRTYYLEFRDIRRPRPTTY